MTDFDTDNAPRNRAAALLGGVLISGAIALGTAVVGFGGGWLLHRPGVVEVPRAPTAEELARACEPEVQEVKDELTTAQTRVAELERNVAEKEGKVADLEGRISRGAEAGKAMRAELERLKAELAETKQQLVVAEAEKQRLLGELRQTQAELAVTKDQRDKAREDALANRWNSFVASAQLEICEKGNRKKLGNCREAVTAVLQEDARRDRFAHCIRSGQAQPMVHEITKDTVMPQFAEVLPKDVKQVEGWYVEYCDPTLPERADAPLAEQHLPPSSPSSG